MPHLVVGRCGYWPEVKVRRWTREVRSSCRFVWVYLPGMLTAPGPWHRSFYRFVPHERALAGSVEMGHTHEPYSTGVGVRRTWATWSRHRAQSMGRLIRRFQQMQPYPLGFIADDFAARIVLEMSRLPQPILPSFLILTNPMLGPAHKADQLFELPGYVRSTAFPWDEDLDLWNLDFDPRERWRGEIVRGQHACWTAGGMTSLRDAAAKSRRVRDW